MKILKYLFFLLLLVIIGGAIYFGTKDGSFNVTESKVIKAPAEVVFNNIKDFKNWQEWGPWMEVDSTMIITYAEKTEGEGAAYSWKSEEMGDGAMETIKVIPNKEIDQKITFNTPLGDSTSDVSWRLENTETPGETKVSWGMKGEQSFMEKVFMGLFGEGDMETELKKMYQKGLNNLDGVVTKKMKAFSINVDGVTEYPSGFYMYTTTSARMSDIAARMGDMMGQVMGYMQQNNIAMAGEPFTIYNQIDPANGTVIFSAGIPVSNRVITPQGSPVVSGFMEATPALKTTLKGDYDNLPTAYTKAQEYATQNDLTLDPAKPMFEVYKTDPSKVPNPSNWITEVYMPILVSTNPNLSGE